MKPACKGIGDAIFFSDDQAEEAQALAICATCPMIEKCRDKTMSIEKGTPREYRFGVFGGLTPDQRADLDGVA